MTWTPERIEMLTALWAEGLSAQKIADRMGGISRNAVIGKANRQHLPSRRARQVAVIFVPRSQMRRRYGHSTPDSHPWKERIFPEGKPDPGTAIPAPEPRCIPLLETGNNECRWPIGDPRDEDFCFCGVQTNGATFCPHHAALAHKPAKPLRAYYFSRL
jgi:GcrA cell cycle regulator